LAQVAENGLESRQDFSFFMKKIPLILLLLATIALFNACKDELSEMEETHFAAKTDTTIFGLWTDFFKKSYKNKAESCKFDL
jgi:hypothetical protein